MCGGKSIITGKIVFLQRYAKLHLQNPSFF